MKYGWGKISICEISQAIRSYCMFAMSVPSFYGASIKLHEWRMVRSIFQLTENGITVFEKKQQQQRHEKPLSIPVCLFSCHFFVWSRWTLSAKVCLSPHCLYSFFCMYPRRYATPMSKQTHFKWKNNWNSPLFLFPRFFLSRICIQQLLYKCLECGSELMWTAKVGVLNTPFWLCFSSCFGIQLFAFVTLNYIFQWLKLFSKSILQIIKHFFRLFCWHCLLYLQSLLMKVTIFI